MACITEVNTNIPKVYVVNDCSCFQCQIKKVVAANANIFE